jgi:UDP-glucuronate 4-epimerase
MHILVTGAAGFIGYHLCDRLLQQGHSVVGLDNLNDYYSPQLKSDRLKELQPYSGFRFVKMDLADAPAVSRLFAVEQFSHVVNLAAQAGVRYSLINPAAYVQSNLVGFADVLEGCRRNGVQHLVYASSSSVYGLNSSVPFSTRDNVDHPISLYAATKKSNELMAHSYSYLYKLPTTGLRFFTVYGPWGRPDMALFIFTKAIFEGRPIPVFNEGRMLRDFTYVDDIVSGVARVMETVAGPAPGWNPERPNPDESCAPYRLYNIGNNQPVPLLDFIHTLENSIGKKAELSLLPLQAGDVPATYADIDSLEEAIGFRPSTDLAAGIENFVRWYKKYYL